MATFPSIKPTYGQQKRSAPNTTTVRFVDGYEHRILFGLAQHQNPKVYNFTFNVSESEADTIENFLTPVQMIVIALILLLLVKLVHKNLCVKRGVNLYLITIELRYRQHLEKYLNHDYCFCYY